MANANDPISQREDVRHQVIEVATKAFHSRGIKNVTMDDIAHSLTMSKRTLYQLFSDKEDLLLACAQQRDAHEEARVEELMQKSNSVFDFLLATFAVKMHEIEHIHPSFFAEMLKFPRVMQYLEQQSREREVAAVEFLNKGKEQGYFRSNVNFHIVYNQLTAGVEIVLRCEGLTRFTQRELFVNTVIPYVRGCATLKGIELIDQFMETFGNEIEW